MHDVVIVGSGAAGVAAALALAERGVRPLILDVGYRPGQHTVPVEENLYDHRAHSDTFDLTIDPELRGIVNHPDHRPMPVKLTMPAVEYVTRGAQLLAPTDERAFCAVQSFAAGGLANAWGAGLYRFTDRDLDGIPLCAHELDPYFDRLTREIGINGVEDDLTPDFGTADGLQRPLEFSRNMRRLHDAYHRHRERLPRSIRLGRPRVAVLTQAHDGRPAYEPQSLEFFQESRAIYTPRYTLDKLVAQDRVDYRPGVMVDAFEATPDGVEVRCRNIAGDDRVVVSCRCLLMAAGAINTARIALASMNDPGRVLALLENPAVQIPFVFPGALGLPLDTDAFGLVGLNLVWDSEEYGQRCQGSIMEITAPARAEFYAGFPFAARSNLALIRFMLPAMFVMQFYLPGQSQEPSRVSLVAGRLCIVGHPNAIDLGKAGPLLSFFRRLGAWTHRSLAVRVPMGHAVHYAGTLPMRQNPGPFECNPFGALHGAPGVYVADSAAFGGLPAKNMSFGMMAHAMRVAEHAHDELRGGK